MNELVSRYYNYLSSEDFLFSDLSIDNIFVLHDYLMTESVDRQNMKDKAKKFAHILNHHNVKKEARYELFKKTLTYAITNDALDGYDFFLISNFPHFIENDIDYHTYREEIGTLRASSNEIVDFINENLIDILRYLIKKDVLASKESMSENVFELPSTSLYFNFKFLKSFFARMVSVRDVITDYFLVTACEIINKSNEFIGGPDLLIYEEELQYSFTFKDRFSLHKFFDKLLLSIVTQPNCGDMTISYVFKNFESFIISEINFIIEEEWLLAKLSIDSILLLREAIFYNNIRSDHVLSNLSDEIYKRISSNLISEDEKMLLLKYGL